MKYNNICWKYLNCFKLFLKLLFSIALFADATFIVHIYSESFINYVNREEIFDISFVNYSLRNFSEEMEEGRDTISNLGNDFCEIFFYVLLLFLIINIVLNVMSVMRPKKTLYYKCQFLGSIIGSVVWVVSCVVAVSKSLVTYEEYSDSYGRIISSWTGSLTIGPWFYISLALCLLIISIELYFILASKQTSEHKKQQYINKDNNVQMLYEYKKMLDDGIITQEEFDVKKKQLL